MPTPEELEQRLNPDHLTPGDQKDKVEKKAGALPGKTKEEPEKDPEEDPKTRREYTFDFEWKDGRGKVWKGKFTNEMLSIRKRQLVGVLRSELGNNLPVDALDQFTQEINLMLAHLAFSLTKKPAWADDLSSLDDVRLVQEIYTEVAAHEATFLGYAKAPETS